MSTPPRRRRPDTRSSSADGGGGWFPTIAMGLGVVIAGLGIGALVAILMQRNLAKPPPVAAVTSTPGSTLAPQRPALAVATIAPPRTPRPTSAPLTLAPATPIALRPPVPNPEPPTPTTQAATPAPVAAVTAEPTPNRIPVRTAAPVRAATPVPVPASRIETAAPVRVAAVTAAPVPSRTPAPAPPSATPVRPSATPVPPPAPPLPSPSTSTYDQRASAVVRRYLDALIRGDVQSAQSLLGATAGTPSEQAFLDPSARIEWMKVTRIDSSNASVGCEIAAAKGHYYATYHITAATGGPYISEHDYIKV